MMGEEELLRRGLMDLTPDVYPRVLADASPKLEKEDWLMEVDGGSRHVRLGRLYRTAAVLAACVVLVLGIGIFQARKITTTVDLDVNPSIELAANKRDKVVKVQALNQDAVEILDGMDLKNVDLNVAVNALIGSMVKNGYLSPEKNAILITVDSQEPDKSKNLEQSLVGDIRDALKNSKISGKIYTQQVSGSQELGELAEKYGISRGKAAFLQKLIEKDGSLKMEQLVSMSIEELSQLIRKRNIDISDFAGYEADESLKENVEEIQEEAEEQDGRKRDQKGKNTAGKGKDDPATKSAAQGGNSQAASLATAAPTAGQGAPSSTNSQSDPGSDPGSSQEGPEYEEPEREEPEYEEPEYEEPEYEEPEYEEADDEETEDDDD